MSLTSHVAQHIHHTHHTHPHSTPNLQTAHVNMDPHTGLNPDTLHKAAQDHPDLVLTQLETAHKATSGCGQVNGHSRRELEDAVRKLKRLIAKRDKMRSELATSAIFGGVTADWLTMNMETALFTKSPMFGMGSKSESILEDLDRWEREQTDVATFIRLLVRIEKALIKMQPIMEAFSRHIMVTSDDTVIEYVGPRGTMTEGSNAFGAHPLLNRDTSLRMGQTGDDAEDAEFDNFMAGVSSGEQFMRTMDAMFGERVDNYTADDMDVEEVFT